MLPFELTKDTPYLALSGELWSVFYEYFNRNWSCYKGFLLYIHQVIWSPLIQVNAWGLCITKSLPKSCNSDSLSHRPLGAQGWFWRLGVRVPLRSRHFVCKTMTLSQQNPFVCRKLMLLPAQLTFQMLSLLKKYHQVTTEIMQWWLPHQADL